MEIFSIRCSTCHAQLNVHSDAVIGQIHACPRCGSMVLVQRPEGRESDVPSVQASDQLESTSQTRQRWAASPPTASTTPEFVESTFEDAVRMVEESPTADEVDSKASPDVSALSSTPVERGASSVNHGELPNQQSISADAAHGATVESTDMKLPDAAWASPAERAWRGWTIYGMAVLTGVVGSAVICGLVISWLAPVHEDEVVNQTPHVNPSPAAESSTNGAAGANSNLVEPLNEKETKPDNGDEMGRPVLSAKPPDINANGDSVTTGDAVDESSDVLGRSELDQGRDEILTADDVQVVGNPQQVDRLENDKLSPNLLAAAVHETSPARPPPALPTIDLAARLADSISEIEFSGQPLVDCLRLVSDLSTIPITVLPESLLFARRSPGSKIELRKQNSTIEEILKEILNSHKLMHIAQENQLIVTNKAPGPLGLKEVTYRLHDLIEQEPTALEEFAGLVRSLVATRSWQTSGGSASIASQGRSLVVRQTGPRHWEILVLCEQLRVARGLSPKSGYPRAQFELTTRTERARYKLSQKVKLNFFQPTRLVDILNRLSEETQTYILVDWKNLLDAGWSADATATLSATNVPLEKVLDDLLAPLGLGYRVVDATVLQVSTHDVLQNRHEIEFYPVTDMLKDGTTDAQLMKRITTALGPQLFQTDQGVLYLDAPSQYLIARLSQHDHQRLSAQLAEWQAK